MIRSLGIHVGILALATAVAARAWLSEERPKNDTSVVVWSGTADAVQSISYTAAKRQVVLNAAKDEGGRYFIAEVSHEVTPEDDAETPPGHGHHGHPDAPPDVEAPSPKDSAGENAANAGSPDADKPKAPPAMKTERFVAITDVAKLVEKLAPLKGLRSLGKVDPARNAEFGFDAADPARIKVQIGGATHELIVGGKTPGGQDVYVRTGDTGDAFVVDGQVARDLEAAEARLLERTLHSWEDDDALVVKVSLGSVSRELGRSADKKAFWADPKALEVKDETATNWMTKLERLRVVQYIEKPAAEPEPLFKVEYFGEGGKSLGQVEVARLPADPAKPDAKPDYVARTEHTRWWGQVLQSTAEQLAQDASGVVSR